MAKICVICGKPGFSYYPFCKEHLELKAQGKIIKCEICGGWHYLDSACPKENTTSDKVLDTSVTNEVDDQASETMSCIICGEETNGYHFCRKCYYRYRNKEILVKINKCMTFEIMDETYEGIYECDDGHIVKSQAERDIDNWLFDNNIYHGYEIPLDVGEDEPIKPDFCLKDYLGKGKDVYIEYFGLKGTNAYDKQTEYKMSHYKNANITLICMYPKTDLRNIRFALQTKLNKSRIKEGQVNYEE